MTSSPAVPSAADLTRVRAVGADLRAAVDGVVQGKDDVVGTAVAVLLAGGHLLVEDVPGLGKTMLAKALSAGIGGTTSRIQLTPDLMPGDITGSSVLDPRTRDLVFRPGAVFADVVIADEINRASPKTQAALLEAMEERQVTIDGVTHPLAPTFLVVATQNPGDMEGTYPLPEAQRDRFMARLTMGYPSPEAEVAMLAEHGARNPLDDVRPATDAAELAALTRAVHGLWAAPALLRYVVDVVGATRTSPLLRLGASPRAGLHLLALARATAALDGRDHVLPADVVATAPVVLAHRVVPASGAGADSPAAAQRLVADIVRAVPVPAAG